MASMALPMISMKKAAIKTAAFPEVDSICMLDGWWKGVTDVNL